MIQTPAAVIYHAGDSVVLDIGFGVETGAEFEAYIEACPE